MNTLERAKYRAKRIDNGEWMIGVPIKGGNSLELTQIAYHSDSGTFRTEVVDAKTVGQFTSLKDKNGVDIFEGCITSREYDYGCEIGQIKFIDGMFSVYFDYDPDASYCLADGIHRQSVIGNIHDNPELLEASK